MTRAIWKVGLISAALLAGCETPRLFCTEIGCSSSVMYVLGDKAQLFQAGQPMELRACIDEVCAVETVTPIDNGAGQLNLQTVTFELSPNGSSLRYHPQNQEIGEGGKKVTLQITKGSELLVDDTREGVEFRAFQPNGEGCEPVCWQTSVTL